MALIVTVQLSSCAHPDPARQRRNNRVKRVVRDIIILGSRLQVIDFWPIKALNEFQELPGLYPGQLHASPLIQMPLSDVAG